MLKLFKGRNQSLVGLDVSASAIKMIELVRDAEGYRVESYGVEPLPENTVVDQNIVELDVVAEAIKRLKATSGFTAKWAAVAVSGSAVITKTIEVPASLNEVQIEEQLLLEADQYIPYPLDEVALDFQVLGPSARSEDLLEVLLAACRREHVDARQAVLESAGLEPEVIDIEAHCVQRAIALDLDLFSDPVEGQPQDVLAIVDIGADLTTLSVVQGSEVLYTREQMFGGRQLTDEIQAKYGLNTAEAGYAKKFGGLPEDYEVEVLAPFKEALLQQVMRSLQFFYSATSYNDVDRVVLAGGTANLVGLTDLIATRLGTPCSDANPFDNMRIGPKVDQERLMADAPAMMIACGLAMRDVDQ